MIPEAQRIANGPMDMNVCSVTLRALPDDTMVVSPDGRALAATFHAYNRLLHVPPTSVPIGGPLATDTDFAAADRALEKCRKDDPIVVPHRRNRLVLFEANFVPPDESGPVQIRV